MRLALACLLVMLATCASGIRVLSQSPDRARVGVLSLHSQDSEAAEGLGASAVRAGLQALGYVEHRNLVLDVRHAQGDLLRLRPLAAELVAARVQIIVAIGSQATEAAREATSSIPIVMAAVGDPLRSGFVESLARPGGHITGISIWTPEIAGKQLEFLKEAAPTLRKVGVLRSPSATHTFILPQLERTATRLQVVLVPFMVENRDDLQRLFAEMISCGVDGVLVLASPSLDDMHSEISNFSLRHRLPGVSHQSYFVRAGLLLSYGASLSEMQARSAVYVDKILKGAKPADLPVEQAERLRFAINVKTAKALGIDVPPSLLVRADEVVD